MVETLEELAELKNRAEPGKIGQSLSFFKGWAISFNQKQNVPHGTFCFNLVFTPFFTGIGVL
ncbi:hypothetical protein LJC61_08725 [Ruminococcaceae bacterium OttesenSCG-928-A16]|nr:hypothetical protein [Ruminococcaceae bacterium OttesenSCG-928-A16]